MIQVGTRLHISDNSGAKTGECIKVFNKARGNFGKIGDIIMISVKEISKKQKSKVKKGNIYKAVIVETAKETLRKDGSSFRFQRNSAVLLSIQGSPLGTRVQGTAPYELRSKNFVKILSLSSSNL